MPNTSGTFVDLLVKLDLSTDDKIQEAISEVRQKVQAHQVVIEQLRAVARYVRKQCPHSETEPAICSTSRWRFTRCKICGEEW